MILSRSASVAAVLALAGGLAGCGDGTSGAAAEAAKQPIVATTTIWADVTSNVACGDEVTSIVPAGADPHSFEPSLRDRAAIDAADVVIANGNDLEHSLVDVLHTASDAGVEVIELTSHVELLHAEQAEHDEHDEQAGEETHDHGTDDPHFWQDPSRVAGVVDVIASAVVAAGADATRVDRCAADYRAKLLALDAEIAEILSGLPPARRLLVTSHDSLGYFADRYDFEVVGTVIPASNTLAETSAAELAELAELIEQLQVPAIFTEQLESTADADALAERLGVQLVPLVTDSLVDEASGDTYVEMLRGNATKIAEALAA
jgi:zinc/manganese transport system substrate-binding protein